MKAPGSALALLASGLMIQPTPAVWALAGALPPAGLAAEVRLARGGGGFRGGGGSPGGAGMRGGGAGGLGGGGLSRPQTGFGGGGGFSRGDLMPSGGFSQGNRINRVGNPSLNRPAERPALALPPAGSLTRPAAPGAGLGRPAAPSVPGAGLTRPAAPGLVRPDRVGNGSWSGNRNLLVNRSWNRQVNINSINLHPGWARPGWGVARPWNWGWYGGWSQPPWGWWAANAALWGIASLATAAMINSAVNNAVSANVSYIAVPNSGYQLQFGSVQPSGEGTLSFVVTADGTSYQLSADCNAGLLNGNPPAAAAEAELLNAACQVAFGNAS